MPGAADGPVVSPVAIEAEMSAAALDDTALAVEVVHTRNDPRNIKGLAVGLPSSRVAGWVGGRGSPLRPRQGELVAATSSVRRESPTTSRERALSMFGGLLGLVMFGLGFLKWLSLGEGDEQGELSGFAWSMPTTAIIGLSLAAGLIALLGATERRPGRGVPSAIPAGLAAAALLLAIGVYLGKDAIDSPAESPEVGVEIGLILGLATAALQTVVLGMGLASRRDDDDDNDARTVRVGGLASPRSHQASAPATSPSGSWRPDPTGRHDLRWWDGTQWTPEVSDNGVQATDVEAVP